MCRDLPLPPRPRQARWVCAVAVALVALYLVAFAVRVHCSLGGACGRGLLLLDLDALGSLPRLVTTALFVATAALASRVGRWAAAPAERWWRAVSVLAVS